MARLRPHLRVLRGSVEVVTSARTHDGCWHLIADCGGLERVPEDARERSCYPDLGTLLRDDTSGRPCRMCALEAVLRTTLATSRRRGRRRELLPTELVTFTSLPASGVARNDRPPTASGQARVRRLARSLGLVTTVLPGTGVIASGPVARTGIPVLLANLHGFVIDERNLEPAAVECFWALAADLRNIDEATAAEHVADLWASARLLTR